MKKKSIYSLTTENLDSLGIRFSGSDDTDTLAITRYNASDNKTIYKYLFECRGRVSYNSSSGKVSRMEFDVNPNSEY